MSSTHPRGTLSLACILVLSCAAFHPTPARTSAPSPTPPATESPAWPVVAPIPGGTVEVGDAVWIVPSDLLPAEVTPGPANNNCAIEWHQGRIYLAWRSAPNHFASPFARIFVVSSGDRGESWAFETRIALGADVREPHLLSFDGRLILTLFEAGINPLAFEPRRMWFSLREGPAAWSEPEVFGEEKVVPWEFVKHGGRVYRSSYRGNHYGLGRSNLSLRFHVSDDGLSWLPVDGLEGEVYRGGVSEAAFVFDEGGDLWAVTRNEDGDRSGFGSHVAWASADDLGAWEFPESCDPQRYDSPRMFRRGSELYLLARRDVGGPYDMGLDLLPVPLQRSIYLPAYSSRPKRSALYRIDRELRRVEHVVDLPGAADTAFPSVVRASADEFLVANYTSPLWFEHRSWFEGQISVFGTKIYFVWLRFADGAIDSADIDRDRRGDGVK